MRATLAIAVSALLTVGGAGPLATQTDANASRARTFDRLWAVVKPYASSLHYRVYGTQHDPFTIEAFYEKDLRHIPRLQVLISVTRQQTIQFRVYTVGNINLYTDTRDPDGLMQKLLRLSDEGFFFWAADEDSDVFAGFTLTLESGFPEEAIKEVLRSIPLLDEPIGELKFFVD